MAQFPFGIELFVVFMWVSIFLGDRVNIGVIFNQICNIASIKGFNGKKKRHLYAFQFQITNFPQEDDNNVIFLAPLLTMIAFQTICPACIFVHYCVP